MPMSRALCVVLMLTAVAAGCAFAAEPDDESRLRTVEDKVGRPRETTPAAAARAADDRRREEERQRRSIEERERWRREHPGDPVPEWVGDQSDDEIWGGLYWLALAAPFAGPYYFLDDNWSRPYGFPAYPFAEGSEGCTVRNGRQWMLNSDMSVQRLSGNILATRADVALNLWRRFAVEGAYSKYEERLKSRMEVLSLQEGLVTFAFARNEIWDFRAGLGIQSIDGKNLNSGVKGVYRVRWFHQPFQVNLDLGLTTGIGASTMSEIAPSVGIHLGRFEYKLGYRRILISGERLAGPEFAVRAWF